MKKLLQRLVKLVAYTAAGVVILLAIAVGLFRLFLPRLPEYQEDIKDWASAAIGMSVEFSGMDARWGLSGPEVKLYNAELVSNETSARVVAADEVSVGVGLLRLLVDRKFVVDRVVVRDTSVEVRQLDNGEWWVQGSPSDKLLPARPCPAAAEAGDAIDAQGIGDLEIILEDIEIQFLQPGDERPRLFEIPRLVVSRDDVRTAIDATVDLPGDLGERLVIAATQLVAGADDEPMWDVTVEANDVELAGISELHTSERARFSAGSGDVEVSLAYANGAVKSATAVLDLDDVAVAGRDSFSVSGIFEFRKDADGWLAAASPLRLETGRGTWPESELRVEAGTDGDGNIVMLDTRMSYLKLTDLDTILPWLSDEQGVLLTSYAPDGIVRNLDVTISDVDTEEPGFDISVELDNVGVAASENRPGARGFTGRLRADRSGGRLEFDAPGLTLNVPRFLGEPAVLDDATGTIIWRRSGNRTTLLSDSIVLANADFEIETNVEISLADASAAPIVDLAATFSITDLSIAKKYIPDIPRIPKTSQWLQEALLAGSIPRGSVRLYGPMDKWPFDGGEGRFYVDAQLRDARIMYQRRWPPADIIDLDLVIENMHLYSHRNHIANVGNEVSNARIELSDFRSPVVTVQLNTTGPLDDVRQLLAQSPMGTEVFGGKLEEIAVTGSGAYGLDLKIPIRDFDAFAFTSTLRLNDVSMKLDGFPAPLTDVNGLISVQREDIASEALGGTFLGQPVSIELFAAPETMPGFRMIAAASGAATAGALTGELGLPLDDVIAGRTGYEARILFPRGKVATPMPFTIELESSLKGLALGLPAPTKKAPEDELPTTAIIELPAGDERIESRGTVDGVGSWQVGFAKEDGNWDLDRGILTFGDAATAEFPETRGLHLRGTTDTVYMQEWFDLGRDSDKQTGLGERIRSIDMTFGNLHIFGQHLADHHVRVDRSARDWLIEIDGEDIVGSAVVPYDFRAGRPLVLDMERLVLPGEENPPSERRSDLDPRTLPTISVKAAEFAFGDRFLGNVEAEFKHTADGLQADSIIAKDATFDIAGNGGWVIDESDPAGHRSYVTATLTSKNVEQTMNRLNYEPGIVADDLSMLLDFGWSGAPSQDFMDSLDGSVKVRIGTGQLDEVEPGAGRMFGLMSIVALPRRLSLDFRDVFSKGFGFDKIAGDFVIEDGQTYTCNLTLVGPAADIAIVGRVGLVTRDYDQIAVVNANFGNTLPVVGAVMGGPQVAAVMLVFAQLFKKPLQEVTQIYYNFGGTFDEPLMEPTTAEAFAERAAALGCLEQTE